MSYKLGRILFSQIVKHNIKYFIATILISLCTTYLWIRISQYLALSLTANSDLGRVSGNSEIIGLTVAFGVLTISENIVKAYTSRNITLETAAKVLKGLSQSPLWSNDHQDKKIAYTSLTAYLNELNSSFILPLVTFLSSLFATIILVSAIFLQITRINIVWMIILAFTSFFALQKILNNKVVKNSRKIAEYQKHNLSYSQSVVESSCTESPLLDPIHWSFKHQIENIYFSNQEDLRNTQFFNLVYRRFPGDLIQGGTIIAVVLFVSLSGSNLESKNVLFSLSLLLKVLPSIKTLSASYSQMLGSLSTINILNNYYKPNQIKIQNEVVEDTSNNYHLQRLKISHPSLREKSQLIAVIGQSGSGKTHAIEKFLKQLSKAKKSDNASYLYLMQNGDAASISLQANLGYPPGELDSSEKTSIFEALNNVGLSKLATSEALATNIDDLRLSIGERQRVIICRGLLSNANVIVYDEPLSSQDPINRDKILTCLRLESRRKRNITIIITHDHDRLESFDNIINITRD